jgi:MFS-type transporter involved in bile tolerance (Atg22 family)
MTILFVWLGSAADYGSFGRWLLLALTITCWALQYGMLGIREPSQWPVAMAMYIVSYVTYGATLVFYAAVFPKLARFKELVRKAREKDLREGRISRGVYDGVESLERNHIS